MFCRTNEASCIHFENTINGKFLFMFFIQLLVYVHIRTVKPRYNEPLCNEVHDITNDFLDPVTVKYMKKNLDITKPSL